MWLVRFVTFGIYYKNSLKILFIYFKREEKGGRKRERDINVWLPLTCPHPGAWPATQAGALTGNETGNSLVCRLALNPLSHTNQGRYLLKFYL